MPLFCENLRRLRLQKGMSQNDLARALGVAKSTISMYESGKRQPDMDTLRALADILEATVSEMLGEAFQRPWGGLSTEERALIEGYRAMGQKEKNIIKSMLPLLQGGA